MTQLALLLLCVSGWVSVTATASPLPSLADTPQTLTLGNGTEVATLDPHKAQGVPESRILRDLFEGLVRLSPSGEIVPGVAQSWSHEAHQRYRFSLRHNARWSNGDPVTATDFVYSFRRAVDPQTASSYAWYLSLAHIRNAHAIAQGKANPDTLGVSAPDPFTLVITLDAPTPYFLATLAHTTLLPVHMATVTQYGDRWTQPEHLVSNGAYQLHHWTVNEAIDLTRNPYYWDNIHTAIDRVRYLSLEDPTSELFRFLTGEIDVTSTVPIEHFTRLLHERPKQLWVQPALCTEFLQFNPQRAPFNDRRVRRALSWAIDRHVITERLLRQGQTPAYTFVPDHIAGYTPWVPEYATLSQAQRETQARQWLKEAGVDQQHPLEFTVLYNTSDTNKKVMIAVASMWHHVLGIKVHLQNQEWKAYLSTMSLGDYDVARSAWCADYNDASAMLSYLESGNLGGHQFADPHYDALVVAANHSHNDEERREGYRQAEHYLLDAMPIAPLFFPVRAHLVSPEIQGLLPRQAGPMSSQNLFRLQWVSGASNDP